jgi:ABC-type amino acid transport substrate-binding protein
MLIEEPGQALRHTVLTQILGVLTSPQFTFVVVLLCVVLLLAGHVIWLIERRRNPDLPKSYVRGVGAGFWWAAVTITTVGYGDKTPRGSLGRSFAMLWMFAGYFVFAYFTASVTTTFTVQELHGTINRPEDLFGKQVGSVKRSAAADYLSRMGISFTSFANVEEAIAELEKGNLDAVGYAAPVLQHYAANQGKGRVRVVGLVFAAHDYGIALQASSPYREQINRALLKLMENGTYTTLYEKWFGS